MVQVGSRNPTLPGNPMATASYTTSMDVTHLRGSQPEKVAHVTAPFLGRESRRETEINAS